MTRQGVTLEVPTARSKFLITPSGLMIKESPSFQEWQDFGYRLKAVEGAVQFAIGDWLNYGLKFYERGRYEEAVKVIGWTKGTMMKVASIARAVPSLLRSKDLDFNHHAVVAPLSPEKQAHFLKLAASSPGKPLSVSKMRLAIAGENKPLPVPKGQYQTIVIDPPWPMEKIEREERPHQRKHLDYPVMSLESIGALPIETLAASTGCHVYLWTTQKFLPACFPLFEQWGVKYECLLTWVKNVGFTPFSFMYSTEHVVFGRVGHLKLLKLGKRLDFNAKVTRHSEKPDAFYKLVNIVSPGPKLDIFARKRREGWKSYGHLD